MRFREAKYRLNEREHIASALNDLISVQKVCVDDEYMRGLYNGLICAHSLITGADPAYFLDAQ